jgi:hypothetical protein
MLPVHRIDLVRQVGDGEVQHRGPAITGQILAKQIGNSGKLDDVVQINLHFHEGIRIGLHAGGAFVIKANDSHGTSWG